MSGGGGNNGPKRKRDAHGGAPNKKAIMTAMHSMPSLNLPPALESSQNGSCYPRKNNKSNNRREWMKECLKLLEAMMEEEDSIPFREPVDCLKYPDFYTMVGDPIDLSKVMLKFRGGQYQDPFDFEKDVKQLFNDYKSFFTDPKTDIYVKTQNLSLWFDLEFRRILEKYGDKLKRRTEVAAVPVTTANVSANTTPPTNTNIMVSINNGSCTILQSPEQQVQSAISEPHLPWSQNMSAKNYGLIQQQIISQPISHHGGPSTSVPMGAIHPSSASGSSGRPSSPYYRNNTGNNHLTQHPNTHVTHNSHLQHMKDSIMPFNASFSPDRTPPHRWPSQDQPMPMIHENSPKTLDIASRNATFSLSAEIGAKLALSNPRDDGIMRGCGVNELNTMSHFRDHSPDFIHHQQQQQPYHTFHPLIRTHTPPERYNRASFSERSFSQHSDPGTFLRRDRSLDMLHSPNSPRYSSSNSPLPVQPEVSCAKENSGGNHCDDMDVIPDPEAQRKRDTAMHANAHVGTTLIGMKLDVNNIFFGKVKCTLSQSVIVHENGFRIPVTHKDYVITFKIKVEEIIRCAAHLGRNKKHTLFIFVTPSFVERLESTLCLKNSKANLIAFFMPAMSVTQIGRLLHVFHNMSKHSIFGNLFNEIDQKGALSLLDNIKPGIMDKMADKVNGGKSLDLGSSSSSKKKKVPTATLR